jgi:class III poly(R)-hydroxyalkanoic acid synthase PhaE subunit
MSDPKSGPDWSKDWQALQRQYWNAWTDLTRSQGAPQAEAAMPWHEGLELWSRMFAGAGKQSEAAERLMSSAKNYLGLMQSMMAFAAGKEAGSAGTMPWLDAMRGAHAVPGFDASVLDNPVARALRDISGQGVKSFEQLASGAAPFLQQFRNEGLSWLQAPAFGYAREHQEHYQKMALAFAEFQQAVQQYNALILKSSQRSFEILENKLAERGEPGRQIDSMRALYDLWVDAAEEAYAEIALSDEFRKVYGDVVNAQMRVRSQLQQEVERIGVDLGMPTRTELNSVHQRLHDLRRELRNGRGDQGRDAEIAAMRAEIDELRRLLENSTPTPGAAAAVRAAKPARPSKSTARTAPRRSARAPVADPSRSARAQVDAAPSSFGDAIAAMRRQAATTSGGKARGARVLAPSTTDSKARPRRSKA